MNKELIPMVIVFVLGVAVGAGGLFFLYSPAPPLGDSSAIGTNSIPQLRGEVVAVGENQARYSNDTYGFSLVYDKALAVKEFDEGGNSMTIVFQHPNEQRGFQMFITPYKESTITEARMKQDIPSGVVRDPQEVLIGASNDIRALAFWSQASIIGESREVWFIKNGYLFEITTYASLDSWIADVVKTIEFKN